MCIGCGVAFFFAFICIYLHLFAFFLHRIFCNLNLHPPPPPHALGAFWGRFADILWSWRALEVPSARGSLAAFVQ